MFYKNWTIFNLCQKKNYIILNFNYPMVNTFLVIFLNKKVESILNPIRKVSLSILPTTFKKKKPYSTKKVKGIKINVDFIFNNFPVHRTGLRLVEDEIEASKFTNPRETHTSTNKASNLELNQQSAKKCP